MNIEMNNYVPLDWKKTNEQKLYEKTYEQIIRIERRLSANIESLLK